MKKLVEIDKRICGIDIIKVVAVFLTISVHFFLNTSYYVTESYGVNMKIQSMIRNFCMICVPLFLITTGFLNSKTEYNKKFFKGLALVLIIWLFYSIIEYFSLNILNGTTSNLNFKDLLFSVTSFTACQYSWYIEMYIGLYLLAPIINTAYNVLNDSNKKSLLFLSIVMIILPNFINAVFDKTFHFPNWWTSIYPIAYYITGKYIADKKPIFNRKKLIILLLFNQVLMMSFTYISSIEFNSLPTFINSVIVFLLLYNIDFKNNKMKKIVAYTSRISLDIYLASSLIDKLIYPIYGKIFNFSGMTQQHIIIYAPLIVITVFILSFIYGSIRKKMINIR